jgi:hypothetical protein
MNVLARLFQQTTRRRENKRDYLKEVHIGDTWETNHYSFTVLATGECPWAGETLETILYGREGVWVYLAVVGFDEILCQPVNAWDWLPLQAVRETISEARHTEPDNYAWDYAALARLIALNATPEGMNYARW